MDLTLTYQFTHCFPVMNPYRPINCFKIMFVQTASQERLRPPCLRYITKTYSGIRIDVLGGRTHKKHDISFSVGL